jgi:hypothetical protein
MSKWSLERGGVRQISSNYYHTTTTNTTGTITVDNTFKISNKIQLKHMRILLENSIIVYIIYNIYITNTMHFNVYGIFYSPKYIINIEVHFVGYLYIMDLMYGRLNLLKY